MNPETYAEIRACLPEGKTPFLYFEDRPAFDLLRWQVGDAGMDIRALKASRCARLLQRPAVKTFLAARGDGRLDAVGLAAHLPGDFEPYMLTIAEWRGFKPWMQTSRPGSNLVLQLNFTNKHDLPYRRFVKPRKPRLFNYRGHPVRHTLEGRHETLAWARIDLDLAAGEALIEEIQSDWVRDAQQCATHIQDDPDYLRGEADGNAGGLKRYAEYVLPFHLANWAEAMLDASLVFLRDELGLRRIWMHDFETGNVAKGIDDAHAPPRSLYTRLPKRFCFEHTPVGPNFICKYRSFRRKLQSLENPAWHYLELA